MTKCVYKFTEETYPGLFLTQLTPELQGFTEFEQAGGSPAAGASRAEAFAEDSAPETLLRYVRHLQDLVRQEFSPREGTATMAPLVNPEVCTWSMLEGGSAQFETRTPNEELTVALWAYGCRTMASIQSGGAGNLRFPMIAAAIFGLLAARGAKEGCSRFAGDLPIMFKGHICKALQIFCISVGHIISANALIANTSAESGHVLTRDGVAHATEARSKLEMCVTLLRNDEGADTSGARVIHALRGMRHIVAAWDLFHRAHYHFYTDVQNEPVATSGMRHARHIVAAIPGMKAAMDAVFTATVGAKTSKVFLFFQEARESAFGPEKDEVPPVKGKPPGLQMIAVEAFCFQ